MTKDARPDRRQLPRWNWYSLPLFLTAGWLVYQLTAQPALGATVACLQFGLTDIKTAFWLRSRDPRPERGRCLFWYYLTWGLLKLIWISYFAIFAAMLCCIYIQSQGSFSDWLAEPLHKILVALIVLIVGTLLAVISGTIAVTSAYRCRQKVWLDSAVDFARKSETWPPTRFTSNQAQTLLGLMACGWLLLGIIVPGLVVLVIVVPATNNGILMLGSVLTGVLAIGVVASLQPLFEKLRESTVATVPADCWDPAELTEIRQVVKHLELVQGEEGPPSLVQ